MKAEYINPFTEAAYYVLQQVLNDKNLSRGKLSVHHDPHVTSGVATVIGITGRLRGHVIFDMEKRTALEIASVMNGENMMGINSLVRSTISELANMITGNAAAKLSALGYECDITPPTFIVGAESEIYAHGEQSHLIVPIETGCGTLTLSVAIAEEGKG